MREVPLMIIVIDGARLTMISAQSPLDLQEDTGGASLITSSSLSDQPLILILRKGGMRDKKR